MVLMVFLFLCFGGVEIMPTNVIKIQAERMIQSVQNIHRHAFISLCYLDPGTGVDGVTVQQQLKWHPG